MDDLGVPLFSETPICLVGKNKVQTLFPGPSLGMIPDFS